MFTIKTIDTNGQWISSGGTESLLDGAQRNGVNIPYACKGGGCGMCKVRVEEGEFERGRSSIAALPHEERELNYTLACKTFPKSDLTVRLDLSREIDLISS